MAKYDFSFLEGQRLYSVYELPEYTELHYTGAVAYIYDKDERDLISTIISDALHFAQHDVMEYTKYYLLNTAEYTGVNEIYLNI